MPGLTKDALRAAVGAVADLALPHLGREIDEARNTGRAPRLKRAILLARLRRAKAQGDAAAVERALSAFWRGAAGDAFHGEYAGERYQVFREQHSEVVEALDRYVSASGVELRRLVEIGCGDGAVLGYCVGRLHWATEAVGLDVNATAIARASAGQAPGGAFSFACAEAREWLTANPSPGTVVISNGGVLEYFSPENFDALLAVLGASAPAGVVLVEPVADDHDLEARPESYPFGAENSFSHNHRFRLEQAGFEVVFAREAPLFHTRGMMMVAVRR